MSRLALSTVIGSAMVVGSTLGAPDGAGPAAPAPVPVVATNLVNLSNGEFEVVVSPGTGRIVRYGRVGQANLLWENPRPALARSPFQGWLNWGGDKVWVWPETDWKVWQNRPEGSPPGDPPAKPYDVVRVDSLAVRMTSAVIPEYGIRIVREIRMAESGSRVRMVNALEKVAETALAQPVAPWVVTQVPAPRQILARVSATATRPGYLAFPPHPWPDVTVEDNVVVLPRPTAPWVKMGLDADLLAVPTGEGLLTARIESPGYAAESCEPHCRAQVFSNPDVSDFRPSGVGPYIELEFTAPVRKLALGESGSLVTVWEVHAVSEGGAAAFLQRR